MESVLKIENLKYKNVLKSVTLSLEEKTFNILIGIGGSGKTTIVNCIRGLVNFEGNINIFGNDINKKNDLDVYKNVGFFLDESIVLEDNVFEELLTLLINIGYDEDKAKKRIYNIAKKFEITELLFENKEKLFSYQKTLILFIFSIIHEPKLLIIDNSLDDLDEKNRKLIFDYLKSQKKLTVLFISNNNKYFELADSLFLLKDGKIVLSGSLDKIVENESIFIKCGSSIPFIYDLSNKLISYEILKKPVLDFEKMVNKIWK